MKRKANILKRRLRALSLKKKEKNPVERALYVFKNVSHDYFILFMLFLLMLLSFLFKTFMCLVERKRTNERKRERDMIFEQNV